MKNKFINTLLLIFILIINFAVNAQQESKQNEKIVVSGHVTDENNTPLSFVNVYILNTFDGAMTDEKGYFSFSTIEKEEIDLVASLIGYKKYNKLFDTDSDSKNIHIVLSPEAITTKEVIVTASSFGSDKEKGLVMSSMDIITTPGGAADIFQSLKTLPGLTQVSESAELYVRGGDPTETITLIDQATINHPYTLESSYGGLFSNINTSAIKGMYFSSGGFSTKYGNALSGVLELETKNEPQRRMIELGLSMANAQIIGEFPLAENKLGIRFNGRQSFTGPIFWINGGMDDFTVVPLSRDLSSSLTYKYSRTGRLKLFGSVTDDKEGVNISMPGYNDEFKANSNSYFFNLQHTDIWFDNLIVKNSISKTNYNSKWNLGILDLTRKDNNYKFRSDLSYSLNASTKINSGFEIEDRKTHYAGVIPAEDYNLKNDAPFEVLNSELQITRYGIYGEIEKSDLIGIKSLFAIGGIRYDYIDDLNLSWLDPRLNLGYKLNENSTFSFGWGIFHQHTNPRLYSETDGNPELTEMKAVHYIAAFDYKPEENENFRVEAYYKDYSGLPLEDDLLNYNNNGYGFAKGIDIMYKGTFFDKLYGWISYGLISTKRKWMEFENMSPGSYDITHNLAVVLNYSVTSSFSVGLNYKYSTGKPYTPVIGAEYIDEQKIFEPLYGKDNSSRYPDYQRLDIRFTYLTNLFDKFFTVLYIEGLNILNIRNLFDYSYNYDYSEKKRVDSYFGRRTIVVGTVIDL